MIFLDLLIVECTLFCIKRQNEDIYCIIFEYTVGELFCSWLVMLEAAILTLVLISLFCYPVTPSGVDRGQQHRPPPSFTKALPIMLGSISTPDKPWLTLRLDGWLWQRSCSCLCWLGWYFLPGFSLHLSRWLGRAGAAVTDKTRTNRVCLW